MNGTKKYIGCTNNFERRIRQHNGELVGGARYTTSHGPGWAPVHFAVGFLNKSEALSFEWYWKRASRNPSKGLDIVLAFPKFAHIQRTD